MFNILQVCTYTCIRTDAERHKCTHNMHAFTICIHVSSFYNIHKTKLTYAHITHQILHIQWGKCYTYKNIFAISTVIFSLFDHCRFPFLVCLHKLAENLLWTATHSTISTIFWTFRKSVFEVVFLVSFVLICFSQSIYFSRNPKAQTNDLSTLRWTSLFLP